MREQQWLWYDEATNTTQAVILNIEAGTLQWFDEPGCACGDNMNEQSIADYRVRGARWLNPPDDVREAIEEALTGE